MTHFKIRENEMDRLFNNNKIILWIVYGFYDYFYY